MAIKRYHADADNTITDAFQENLTTRGTGSNMGQADVLETFSIYAQQSATSTELSRILIRFPISDISRDRTNGLIPSSGSVSFFLKMFNAEHPHTLPRNYTLDVLGVSGSWQEGNGLDMEGYTDLTHDTIGSNWVSASSDAAWVSTGGDYYTDSSSSFKAHFDIGNENLDVDVTTLVEQWIHSDGNILGAKENHGFGIKLSSSFEAFDASSNPGGARLSYYTKKFFARSSEYFFDRPVIEARWDSARRDNRGNFYFSSSLAPASENLNTLFMYNYIRGNLRDIGGNSNTLPVLRLYYSSGSVPEGDPVFFRNSANNQVNHITASRESTGVYSATFSATSSVVNTVYPYLVDVWSLNDVVQLHTGSAITPKTYVFSNFNPNTKYLVNVKNLKPKYTTNQTERFRLYVREKNWSPNIFTSAKTSPDNTLIESASFQITRVSDKKIVIPYGTGSYISCDSRGNFIDLNTSGLQTQREYKLLIKVISGSYAGSAGTDTEVIDNKFTFFIR